MGLLQILIVLMVWAPVYFIPIYALNRIMRAIDVSGQWRIFLSVSIFGILLGFLSSLSLNNKEALFSFNMPGMYVGEQIYNYAIQHIGDPHSSFAHYTIPWILRIPQGYMLPSAVIWSFLGAIGQVIYNLFKKPVPAKGSRTLIAGLSTLSLFCLSFVMIYGLQSKTDKYGPTEPTAVPVMEIILPSITPGGTPTRQLPPITYANSTTFRVDSLSLSKLTVKVGESFFVSALITNTGPAQGMAEVKIEVNTKVIGSQKVALATGEGKTAKFVVTVPKPGTYSVIVGGLSEEVEVI